MGLLGWPRSIRGKLILALTIAVAPMMAVVLLDESWHIKNPGELTETHLESVILVVIAATLLSLVVICIAGNRLSHPIRRLALAANAIAVGDYRKRVKIRTQDELQALAEALNSLGRSLARKEALMKLHAEMLAGMAEAARIASSSLHIEECGKAVAKVMCTHLGARDATVFRRKTGEEEVKPIGRCGKRTRSAWKLIARRVTDSGEQLMISERNATNKADQPGEDAYLVGVPLRSGESSIGAIVARFEGCKRSEIEPGSVRGDLLSTFGIHAAAAIGNAEAYSASEEYSEVLEEWVDHLSSVMQVTDMISPSLTLDETLEALAKSTAAALNADLCSIFRPDQEGFLTLKACSRPDLAGHARAKFGPSDSEVAQAFAHKKSIACRDLRRSRFPASRKMAEVMGMRSSLSTPLVVEDRAIGAISVASSQPRQFMPREIRLLTSISLHAAVIVRNADLYTREFSIAESLQSNLVSEAPEECQGIRFATRYIPALEEARVGGDFYEVTPLPNGKIGIVIGDVSGKGLRAAIHLAACKYMMKPLMWANPNDPAAVLNVLNESLNYYFDGSFFVTIFYGVVDPETGEITYANAGHLPALLISNEGRMHSWLLGTGIPAGAGEKSHYENLHAHARRSDLLLLYTDGVTDVSSSKETLGIEGLEKLVFEAGDCTAKELVDSVCHRLLSDPEARQRDDMALLAASFENVNTPEIELSGGSVGQGGFVPSRLA